jgi:DNA-binding CsgD family transcriptional regulator
MAWLAESLAEALISLGEWDEATSVLQDAVAVPLSGQAAVTVHCLTGMLAVRRGDVAAAREHLDVARRHTPPQEDALLSQRLPPRWLAAELAATQRDLATVRSTLAPLWESPHPEVVSESIWRPMLLLARLEADDATLGGGSTTTAAESWTALDRVTERLHRLGPTGEAWRLQLAAERSRAAGEHDLTAWSAVVQAWAALGQKPEQGYALARLAECHARDGDRERAAEVLSEADAIAGQLRAAPLSAEVAGLSRRLRLGVKSTSQRQRAVDGNGRLGALTPREVEVLTLVAEGLDNAGVAQRLVISSKTASVHVSNILAKLGATSRTQAASMALRHGLITLELEDPK